MKSIDKTLEYHELLMTLDDLQNTVYYDLPQGYKFVFWNSDKCLNDWIDIHLATGEFASIKEAEKIFHLYYDKIYNEIQSHCFFIENETGVKVATATVSPTEERGYFCALDWIAVSESSQGRGLGKAIISRCIKLAKELGYDKIILHTQTHTWLAAKLYLDMGFEPLITADTRGWQILKTLTDHAKLKSFAKLKSEEIYDILMINIKNLLFEMHGSCNFSVWYVGGRNDVLVNANGNYFHYKFYDNGKTLKSYNK